MDLFLRQLGLWTAVCCFSAGPSFVWGHMGRARTDAMLLGIGIFILLYTAISCTDFAQKLRARPAIRRTMRIGYGTRIGLSLLSIIPVLSVPDVFCGIISVSIVEKNFRHELDFTATLLTTLIQGCILNIVLFIYMLFVWGIVAATISKPRIGLCARCGYDLRASTALCPECGEPIPSTPLTRAS